MRCGPRDRPFRRLQWQPLTSMAVAHTRPTVPRANTPAVLLQCLFDRFGSVFPQCGLMVFPGVVIVSR